MNIQYRSLVLALILLCASCTAGIGKADKSGDVRAKHYGLDATLEVIVTSEQGDRLSAGRSSAFRDGQASGTVVHVDPGQVRQTITGIGSSFTESSAFVLSHLEQSKRQEVMQNIYGEDGANFSLARTVIASTDFAVEGKYTHAPIAGDVALKYFTIDADMDGFSKTRYPGVKDESYDLLPMIKEAQAIKASQHDSSLNIVASAWTAPPWMKDIETWYIQGGEGNEWQGTGGSLKEEYVGTYADYLVKYLDAYDAWGVDIWGLTPVNEPQGNGGNWESMHFTAEGQRDFIRDYLGPKLHDSRHRDTRVLIYDQNRDHLTHWADVILSDPGAAQYVYGTAIHWYASTNQVFEKELNQVRNAFPQFDIIHTEGTIDNLGVAAPSGITDPDGFQEENWYQNDEFWWNETSTDWAYSATWAPRAEDHPMYTPVHRYARNIIVSLNNWVSGWIDWNVVLDHQGGPNHVGNFCGAPIMIDTRSGDVYYTPIYHVLSQFSRTIRPGDKAVQVTQALGGLGPDSLHASATINSDQQLAVQLLNTTKKPVSYSLQVGAQYAEVVIPANAIQTVRLQLNP